MDKDHGMSIQEFLQGEYLQRGDIVLCRGKKGVLSRLIRWGTDSYFSHAALVFAVPHHREGFDKAFVIESVGSGIDLSDIQKKYLDSNHYDIAIKRLEKPWFTEHKQKIPKLIRGHMLNFIKAKYDYGAVLYLALNIIRELLYGSWWLLNKKLRHIDKLREDLIQGKQLPTRFICSGFVQHGYYKTIEREIEEEKLPKECLQEVIFHPSEDGSSNKPRRLATTPKELAVSNKLVWKFASIRENGVTTIYPISSREELEGLYGPL